METDGEASNPGPLHTFCTNNITSLNTQYRNVLQIPADTAGLQEVRLTEPMQILWKRDLKEAGWEAVWGKPLPPHASAESALPGGVGIISRHPLQLVKPSCQLSTWLWDTTRFVHACVLPAYASKQPIHVVCVYGHSKASTDPARKRQNEELLDAVFQYIAQLGNVPVVILGDFNTQPNLSSALNTALTSGQYFDCLALLGEMRQEVPANTCFVRNTSQGSRIDLILSNINMVPMLRDGQVLEDAKIPVHRPVLATFELDAGSFTGQKYRIPQSLPLDWQDPDPDAEQFCAEEMAQALKERTQADWDRALHSGNINEVLQHLSETAEEYIIARSQNIAPEALGLRPVQGSRNSTGRGRMPRLVQQQAHAPHQRLDMGASNCRLTRLQKLLRRCDEIVRKYTLRTDPMQPIPQDWWNLWRNACADGGSLLQDWGCWISTDIPHVAMLQHICRAIREVIQDETVKRKARRRETWAEWFMRDWAHSRQDAFEFARGGQVPATPLLEQDDGTLTGDPQRLDELLHQEWMPIFQLYTDLPPPSWGAFEARYRDHLPRGDPLVYSQITVEMLRETLRRMKGGSAIGLDGFRVKELRCLPDFLLERLCEMYTRIEEEGVWPDVLSEGLISMISKGEGLRPKDLRPITVTSVLYRLWSATRVREILTWQESWASPSIFWLSLALGL